MTPIAVAIRSMRSLPRASTIGLVALVVAIFAASVALIGPPGHPSDRFKLPRHAAETAARITVQLPPPDLYRSLTPEQAIAENAKRAAAARPDTPAAAFIAKSADDESRARALECLTQAIYYEAASESVDGQRAVAQIVLNRVRHPAYPASICGVVYQGSERTTGCQFSFTCDGSLRRTPAPALWQRARKLAADALAGKVFGPVGHATYYHADYVLPYWADSLDKEVQIGRHIFYRLRGGLGSRQAFGQRYRGQEPSPLSPTDLAVVDDAFQSPDAKPTNESGFAPLTAPATDPAKPAHPVLADITHGELLVDEGKASAIVVGVKRPPSSEDRAIAPCATTAGQMATKTVATNNRLGAESADKCR